MSQKPNKRYGRFALAATAYIAGVILFSVWSYTAHRSEMLAFIDKSLLDAAIATREIADLEQHQSPSSNSLNNQKISNKVESRLVRMVRHGQFESIGIAQVIQGHIELKLTGMGADNELLESSIKEHLQQELTGMSSEGHHDVALFTIKSPPQGYMRVAVAYDADSRANGVAYLVIQHSHMIEAELGDQMIRLGAAGLGMLILAVPLIILFSRTQKETAIDLSHMNKRLLHDVDQQQYREEELKDAIHDLQRFNAVSAGRETRIIELKAEVNNLLDELNRDKRYNIDRID